MPLLLLGTAETATDNSAALVPSDAASRKLLCAHTVSPSVIGTIAIGETGVFRLDVSAGGFVFQLAATSSAGGSG